MRRFLQDIFEAFLFGIKTMATALAILAGSTLAILTAGAIIAKIFENIL